LWQSSFSNLTPVFPAGGAAKTLGGIIAVFVTVPFWFVGFDTIPQGAEEARGSLPPRRLGVMIIAAILSATLFYALLILSASGASPWQQIADAELPTAAAFQAAFSSRFWVNLVLTAALIGLLTSWNGFFLAGSRVLFALGRGSIIPPAFGETHAKHGTPGYAVLFCGGVTFLAALMGRGAMLAFVNVGSFCIAVAFLGVALSTARLRKNYPDLHRPYRIPGGLLIPRAALVGSLLILGFMLVPGSPAALGWPEEWLILGVFLLIGVALWYGGARMRDRVPEDDRDYLILGDYGKRTRQ
jgi:amino acid transporter